MPRPVEDRAELARTIARKRIDEEVYPLVRWVDSMPNGPEKAKAMSHLHAIIGGFSSVAMLADGIIRQIKAGRDS